MSKGCHGHRFKDYINFSFHLYFCGGYWNMKKNIIVVPLNSLRDEKTAGKTLAVVLAHELGHKFCQQEFPADINKKAAHFESKAFNFQEKMMRLFEGQTERNEWI